MLNTLSTPIAVPVACALAALGVGGELLTTARLRRHR